MVTKKYPATSSLILNIVAIFFVILMIIVTPFLSMAYFAFLTTLLVTLFGSDTIIVGIILGISIFLGVATCLGITVGILYVEFRRPTEYTIDENKIIGKRTLMKPLIIPLKEIKLIRITSKNLGISALYRVQVYYGQHPTLFERLRFSRLNVEHFNAFVGDLKKRLPDVPIG